MLFYHKKAQFVYTSTIIVNSAYRRKKSFPLIIRAHKSIVGYASLVHIHLHRTIVCSLNYYTVLLYYSRTFKYFRLLIFGKTKKNILLCIFFHRARSFPIEIIALRSLFILLLKKSTF